MALMPVLFGIIFTCYKIDSLGRLNNNWLSCPKPVLFKLLATCVWTCDLEA